MGKALNLKKEGVSTKDKIRESKTDLDSGFLMRAGKRLYKVRCSTIERSFADAKEIHSYNKSSQHSGKVSSDA
ncbi:hypothetical protein ACEOWJ_000981 [Bacillus cereus]|uniref:hypothetical protein n=1 Tax=Bacillus TaxID=1386 RepID=UPI000556FAF8|nr:MULTISPECIES: hypothetical protein [unclassified Bacillus (in: firmicutes)]